MSNAKILITFVAVLTILFCFAPNDIFADGSLVLPGSINPIGDTDQYRFTLEGTDNTSTLVATLVCGNSINPSKILDPILTVSSPSLSKFDDDSFTPCNNYFSSFVLFSAGEVVDGSWRALAGGYQGLGDEVGPYTLTIILNGPGCINLGDQVTGCDVVYPKGKVTEVVGDATIIHSDGSRTHAIVNSPIYEGDVIETSAGGALNILFEDNTSFGVDESSRMSVDQYFQEQDNGFGLWSAIQGGFIYLSGLIAHDDPANVGIDTPAGCICIRGTEFIWRIDPITEIEEIHLIEGIVTLILKDSETTTEFSAPITIIYDSSGIIGTSPLSQEGYDSIKNQISFPLMSPSQQANILASIGNFYGANTSVLGNVPKLLNDGNPNNDKGACGKLGAFINKVNSDKILTSSQKTQLIDDANAIKTGIGC